jgi:CDP-diacylglycerol pyrophosphatase
MTREKTLFIIALLVMIMPHVGLTNTMEQIALFVLGLIVIIFAYGMYFERRASIKKTIAKKKILSVEHQTPLRRETIQPKTEETPDTGFVVLKKRENKTEEHNFNI